MTAIRIIDLETTGIDPEDHRIVEIAAFDLLPDGQIVHVGSHLVNPNRDIPPEASAVHHLIDVDLADAPLIGEVWHHYFGQEAPTIIAAHNSAFEQSYIPTPKGGLWLCTFKAALRAWPEAPGHSNQALRYWRRLDAMEGFDRAYASLAHRAGPDAYVTAWLVRELLQTASLQDLIEWTAEPKVFPRITFGKHRGAAWSDIPSDYLQWLRDGQHQMEEDWRHGAKIELARR